MSAGRHWRSGMSEGNSFRGAKAADWAVEKIASRIELWQHLKQACSECLTHAHNETRTELGTGKAWNRGYVLCTWSSRMFYARGLFYTRGHLECSMHVVCSIHVVI